jgi:hypothetical protein
MRERKRWRTNKKNSCQLTQLILKIKNIKVGHDRVKNRINILMHIKGKILIGYDRLSYPGFLS